MKKTDYVVDSEKRERDTRHRDDEEMFTIQPKIVIARLNVVFPESQKWQARKA
ncbi:hypothetical protein KIN20_009051 [Parelaphostrongylus tenuis]|uniref:Uncharacterized protein n=1 Tax=Parelaphostrongylus tenuis TaxID=148309 RepID=A0AAD5M5P6_PARTN|nr:hypothetical protein KIN20_009051 [Parelaphostrongylus tenuis]